MPSFISTDVLIVGAGVAGLWLNARLRRQGFSTVLVESASLGGGQSIKSQGIIHGGAKYALHGALTGASEAIADMPRRWREALSGEGELDLYGVRLLSEAHRSEVHTTELQSLMRISYAVFCLKKNKKKYVRMLVSTTKNQRQL